MIWIPPGQKRWHGATTTAGTTHIGIVEPLDGKVVEWMGKVSEEQYRHTLVLLGQNLEELAQVLPEAAA